MAGISHRHTIAAAYVFGCIAVGMTGAAVWISEECKALRLEVREVKAQAVEAKAKAEAEQAKAKEQAPAKTPATLDQPLAVRNNNPLNVKAREKDPWRGQIGADKYGHAVFASPEHGLRAASIVLNTYAKKHKIGTIRGLVERFAEANHDAYAAYLSKALGVAEDESIDLVRRMPELLPAMARFETGKAWPEEYFLAFHVLGKL